MKSTNRKAKNEMESRKRIFGTKDNWDLLPLCQACPQFIQGIDIDDGVTNLEIVSQ